MKSCAYILLFLLSSSIAFGQSQLEWQKTYGGSETDGANHVQQTEDGGYIVSGYSESSDGDLDNNDGIWDIWILKLDDQGDIEWEKTFGGTNYETARVIKQTREGGFIFIGWTRSSDGDISSHAGNNDIWVVKLTASGDISWEQTFGGMYHDQGFYIQQTSEGGYILSGTTTDSGSLSAYVIKLDELGIQEWESVISGDALDQANTIIEVSTGGYILVGNTKSSFGEEVNRGAHDCMVVKLSATGDTEWLKLYGGVSEDFGNSIIESNDGSFVIAGSTEQLAGDVLSVEEDVWVFKIDAFGNKIWERTFGTTDSKERAISIEAGSNNTWILTGYTESDNGDDSVLGGFNCYVLKLTPNGSRLWDRRFGGVRDDFGNFIMETQDGSYIATGFTYSADGDFDFNNGDRDLFIMKILPVRTTAVNELQEFDYTVFPNPSTNFLEFHPRLNRSYPYQIINSIGEIVASGILDKSKVDVQPLQAGNYTLIINQDNQQKIIKFIKISE